MDLQIVALAGGAGVGKDYLVTRYFAPLAFQPTAFGDNLKIELVGRGLATFDEAFVTKSSTVRSLMQQYSAAVKQEHSPEVWVHTLYADIHRMHLRFGFRRFVLTDVRYPREVAAIHAWGGTVIGVHAPDRWAANGMTLEQRRHDSEQFGRCFAEAQSTFDAVIYNDSEAEETLDEQVASVLQQTLGISPLISSTVRVGLPAATVSLLGGSLPTLMKPLCLGCSTPGTLWNGPVVQQCDTCRPKSS